MLGNIFFIFVALCASCRGELKEGISVNYTAADPQPTASVSVWTGQNLTLSCDEDEKHLAQYHRLWRKGSQLLSASTVIITLDSRFQIVNEHVLTLNNVTRSDEGKYTCEIIANPPVKKKYTVTVNEVICSDPYEILNGFIDPKPGSVDTFRYGDEIVYSCLDGYVLIGESVRTCLHPNTGWDGDPPKCESSIELTVKQQKVSKLQTGQLDVESRPYSVFISPLAQWQEPKFSTMKEVAEVNVRMTKLENKLQKVFSSDMAVFHKVEEKFSDLENRVKRLEGDTGHVMTNRNKNELMEREVHHLKTAVSLNAIRAPWESFLNTNVARLGVRDGHIVSEYTWFVPDFDSKMKEYRDMNFDYIESKPFYTHVPGYHMVLHVYPNYDQTDNVGFYAILLPGRFDGVVAWPFTSKYVLAIATVDAEASDVFDTIVPARAAQCKFEKPPPGNNVGCGFAAFVEHSVLHEKAHLHKSSGGVLFRMSVYLDD